MQIYLCNIKEMFGCNGQILLFYEDRVQLQQHFRISIWFYPWITGQTLSFNINYWTVTMYKMIYCALELLLKCDIIQSY